MPDLKFALNTKHISGFDKEVFDNRKVVINQPCYEYTMGLNSSCGGAVA